MPWPATLRSLLVVFGALNLDFVDPDAASRWLGRSVHYGTATLGLCFAFFFILLARFLNTTRPSLALDLDLDLSPEPDSEPDPLPLPRASSSRIAGSSRRACAAVTPRGVLHSRTTACAARSCAAAYSTLSSRRGGSL